MPKIVITLTKANADPWIISSKDSLQDFTEEEKLQVLKPYFDYLKALPGYSYEQSLAETYVDGDTSVTTICFDTEANMLSAKELLFGNNVNSVVQNRNTFMKNKVQSANVVYNRVITTQ
jgi:hypothetical protein